MINGVLSIMAAQPESAESTGIPNAFNTILLVLVCIAVIIAAYYTTKLVARKAGASTRSQHMLVLDRLSISNDKQILLIKVGDVVQMVGVSGQSINHIATLDEDDIPETSAQPPRANASGVIGSFAERLAAYTASTKDLKNAREMHKRNKAPKSAENTPASKDTNTSEPTREGSDTPTTNHDDHNDNNQNNIHDDNNKPDDVLDGGLDSLDDMVNKRKRRFEKAVSREDAEV